MICKTCIAVVASAFILGAPLASCTEAWGNCGSDATGPSSCVDNFYCQPWDTGFYQCMPTPEQCQTQITNIEFVGPDLETVKGIQAGECCTKCVGTPGCVAYTFANSNPDGPACHLKSDVSRPRGKKTVVSGIVGPKPTNKCLTQVRDVDYWGDDLSAEYTSDVGACCEKCSTTSGCVAYTYASWGICYMKRGTGDKRPLLGAISGLAGGTLSPANTCTTPKWGYCGNSGGSTCCPDDYYCQPWSPSFSQCIEIPKKCSGQLTDQEYNGANLQTVYLGHPSQCCDKCDSTPGCVGYTFINVGMGQPVCYLKSALGTAVPRVGAVAGKRN